MYNISNVLLGETGMGKRSSLRKHLDFILVDFLVIFLSFYLAYFLRFGEFMPFSKIDDIGNHIYSHQLNYAFIALVVTLFVSKPYKGIIRRNRWQELIALIKHTAQLAAINVLLLYFSHQAGEMSRSVVSVSWALYFIIEYAFRTAWKPIIRRRHSRPDDKSSMLLITSSDRAKRVIDELHIYPFRKYFVSAVFYTDNPETYPDLAPHTVKYQGQIKDCIKHASHHWVDEVFIDLIDNPELVDKLVDGFDAMGITTHTTVDIMKERGSDGSEKRAQNFGRFIVVTQNQRIVPNGQWMQKRLIDLFVGIIGCLLTIILTIVVGPIIFIKSPGHIFFKQQRVGRNGKKFTIYKFRSMYPDADKRKQEYAALNTADGMMFKADNDPRIIKGIGKFIRRTSIDEFPQFFNVIKGDMSVVGTRPPTLDEWEKYSPEHRARMSIKPGITGMWQISGRSNITDFDKVVELDTQYIKTWTIPMDIRIILRTVLVVIKNEGAK